MWLDTLKLKQNEAQHYNQLPKSNQTVYETSPLTPPQSVQNLSPYFGDNNEIDEM